MENSEHDRIVDINLLRSCDGIPGPKVAMIDGCCVPMDCPTAARARATRLVGVVLGPPPLLLLLLLLPLVLPPLDGVDTGGGAINSLGLVSLCLSRSKINRSGSSSSTNTTPTDNEMNGKYMIGHDTYRNW